MVDGATKKYGYSFISMLEYATNISFMVNKEA